MDVDIVQQLIDESMKNVAGVDGRKAESHDKIIVVFAAKWASENPKSKRARAAEAAIPVGGVVSVIGGSVLALFKVFGVA